MLLQLGIQVHTVFFHGQGLRLFECVESSQAVTGTTATPVFRDGKDHGKVSRLGLGRMGANACGKAIHPVLGLVIVSGTDNRHIVEIIFRMHGLNGGLKSGVSHGRLIRIGVGKENKRVVKDAKETAETIDCERLPIDRCLQAVE
jgi:hypothetical protein